MSASARKQAYTCEWPLAHEAAIAWPFSTNSLVLRFTSFLPLASRLACLLLRCVCTHSSTRYMTKNLRCGQKMALSYTSTRLARYFRRCGRQMQAFPPTSISFRDIILLCPLPTRYSVEREISFNYSCIKLNAQIIEYHEIAVRELEFNQRRSRLSTACDIVEERIPRDNKRIFPSFVARDFFSLFKRQVCAFAMTSGLTHPVHASVSANEKLSSGSLPSSTRWPTPSVTSGIKWRNVVQKRTPPPKPSRRLTVLIDLPAIKSTLSYLRTYAQFASVTLNRGFSK